MLSSERPAIKASTIPRTATTRLVAIEIGALATQASALTIVVTVRIAERKVVPFSSRVRRRLCLETADKRRCTQQCPVEIVQSEEQQQAIARLHSMRAVQGRVLLVIPSVKAE
jgi:hypothetical protein